MATIFTYDKNSGYYTEEWNEIMDYIVRNLPGVTVTAEEGSAVQVSADKMAAKVIRNLYDSDLITVFPEGYTIEDARKLMPYKE